MFHESNHMSVGNIQAVPFHYIIESMIYNVIPFLVAEQRLN